MKTKWILCLMAICLLISGIGMAEGWLEDRSPSHPYPNVPEVDLTKTIGYMMLYPKATKPAEYFCDSLTVYLPREDVKAGEGKAHLFFNGTEIFSTAFNDASYVELRKMNADELDGLLWGGGCVFIIHLPTSLQLNGNYYVTLDEGCIVNTEETLKSPPVLATDAWEPKVTGDYGIQSLTFQREGTVQVTPEPSAEGDETGTAQAAETVPTMESVARNRRKGDRLSFRLVLGGNAASAVVYDPDLTIDFDNFEMTSSGTYTGTVIANAPGYWGIVFLDAQGNLLNLVELGY